MKSKDAQPIVAASAVAGVAGTAGAAASYATFGPLLLALGPIAAPLLVGGFFAACIAGTGAVAHERNK